MICYGFLLGRSKSGPDILQLTEASLCNIVSYFMLFHFSSCTWREIWQTWWGERKTARGWKKQRQATEGTWWNTKLYTHTWVKSIFTKTFQFVLTFWNTKYRDLFCTNGKTFESTLTYFSVSENLICPDCLDPTHLVRLKGNSSIFKPRPYFRHEIRSSTHREQFGESRRPSEDIWIPQDPYNGVNGGIDDAASK